MNQDTKKLPPKITIAESVNFTFEVDTKTNAVKLDINKIVLDREINEIVKLVSYMASCSFVSKELYALYNQTIKTPEMYSRIKFLEPIQKYLSIIQNEEAGRLFWENRYILEKYATPQSPEGGEGAKPDLEIVKKNGK